jgi:DNA-binding response OmpR family regulator
MVSGFRLLLIEDDETLRGLLRDALVRYGYQVICADGDDFARLDRLVEASRPHLILLDVMLPVFDGFYWVRRFRARTAAPILVISIRGHPLEQVRGLELGADDYVPKPFPLELLLAKIEAWLRRTYGDLARAPEELVSYAGLTVDRARGRVLFRDRTVLLTPVEQRLLLRLVQARGRVVEREQLLLAAWSEETFVEDNTLSVNVARLRRKLESLGFPGGIEAVRGLGYRLVTEEERSRVGEEYEGE